jgi:hypothetical protein
VLLTSIAIGVERFDVRDEHSANFASITQLVFLLMILQHGGESPEDIARASLHEVQIHGPKIIMLPRQRISQEGLGVGVDKAENARKKFTIICYSAGTRENWRPVRSNG